MKIDSFSLVHIENFSESKDLESRILGLTGIEALIKVIIIKRRVQLGTIDRSIYVLVAATGAGKSTFMIYYLFDKFLRGRSGRKTLICTQPKVSQAQNNAVGVQAIFGDKITLGKDLGYLTGPVKLYPTDNVNILYCTTQILTNQIRSMDPKLFAITHPIIVIDEAHDQSVEMLTLLKEVKKYMAENYLYEWCPLLIITSATIYPPIYINYLGGNAMGTYNSGYISGSTRFPIKQEYTTPIKGEYNASYYIKKEVIRLCQEITKLKNPTHFDILCFFPIVSLIRKFVEDIAKTIENINGWKIYPISLSRTDIILQNENFKKAYGKPTEMEIRVICATPVVETGATFPYLYAVIDSGTAGSVVPFPLLGISVFLVNPISEYSRIQRQGRVGRTGPGKYIGIFSEEVKNLMKTKPPSSTLTNVSIPSTIFNMIANESMRKCIQENRKPSDIARYLAIDKIGRRFPPIDFMNDIDLLEPISIEMYLSAICQLQTLGLLDKVGRLTNLGIQVSYHSGTSLAETFLYSELMNIMCNPIDAELLVGICKKSFMSSEIGARINWELSIMEFYSELPKDKINIGDIIEIFIITQSLMIQLWKNEEPVVDNPKILINELLNLIERVITQTDTNLLKSHFYTIPYFELAAEEKIKFEDKVFNILKDINYILLGISGRNIDGKKQ